MHDVTHTLHISLVGPMGTDTHKPFFLYPPPQFLGPNFTTFEHTILILGAKMSSEFDVAFLDTLSSRLLNDFRDAEMRCPRTYLDILNRLHFQQCSDISRPQMDQCSEFMGRKEQPFHI